MELEDLDPSQGIGLFTDGSSWCKDRSGGWAWLAMDVSHKGYVTDCGAATDTTNNRMEMTAWIEGLNRVFEAHGPCEVIVWSDSEYIVLGVRDHTRHRRKNNDLWAELDKAIERHTYVECQHVYGHHKDKGHQYNEVVDKLAGEARRNGVSI